MPAPVPVRPSRRRRREVAIAGYDAPAAERPDPVLDSELVAALRRLPLRQREVITLRLLLDLHTTATAGLLGISPGTVAVHLHRGLAALRQEVQTMSSTTRS